MHDFILRYKEYATRLGDKLSAGWGLTALRKAFLVEGTENAKNIVGPVFAVFDITQQLDPQDALTDLLDNLEKVAEEAARTTMSTNPQGGSGRDRDAAVGPQQQQEQKPSERVASDGSVLGRAAGIL